jgi:hypothetical protein
MSMEFDATLKKLGTVFPADFLTAFDEPPTQPVSLLNVDLSTVTKAADLIIGLGNPLAEIIHIDFQSGAMARKHADVLLYNSLLFAHYLVPVHSIVLLLRPSAAHSNLNGTVTYAVRPQRGRMNFTYEVIPLWRYPVEDLLAGGPGTLPLAVLGQLPEGVDLQEGITAVAQRIISRLEAEASEEQRRQLLTAAFVLAGLRLPRDRARQAFAGVRAMRDSDTYLAIMDEGREQQAKRDILRLGTKRCGPPGASITTQIEGITDIDRLERIHDRMLEVETWEALLETP